MWNQSKITVNRGVFNFNQSFPGPHMLRVRLTRDQAWETLQELVTILKTDDPECMLTYFGELVRDAEEDQGNPIEVEGHE